MITLVREVAQRVEQCIEHGAGGDEAHRGVEQHLEQPSWACEKAGDRPRSTMLSSHLLSYIVPVIQLYTFAASVPKLRIKIYIVHFCRLNPTCLGEVDL